MAVLVTPLQMLRFSRFLADNQDVFANFSQIHIILTGLAISREHYFSDDVRQTFAEAAGIIKHTIDNSRAMDARIQNGENFLDFFTLSPDNNVRDAHGFFNILVCSVPQCSAYDGQPLYTPRMDEALKLLGWPEHAPTLSGLAADVENYEHLIRLLRKKFSELKTDDALPIYQVN